MVSDTDLANLVAPNSGQKSRKSGDENLIPSYLFDKTDTDIKTSTPVKEEGSDEMKMTKMLFDKKVKKIPQCEGLEPADKVSQLRLRLTQWLSTNRIVSSEVSI